MSRNRITEAIALLGLKTVADLCSISYQAVRKWERKGSLPRTEYTGETNYAELIATACRNKDPASEITREALLSTGHRVPSTASEAASA